MSMKTTKYKLPKRLVLNYRTWRCGGDGKEPFTNADNSLANRAHGKGTTALLNEEGYACCLGQFSLQAGCSRKQIRKVGDPADIETYIIIGGLSRFIGKRFGGFPGRVATRFSMRAMAINDDDKTTIAKKAVKLIGLCKKFGYTLKLKNFPKKILEEIK